MWGTCILPASLKPNGRHKWEIVTPDFQLKPSKPKSLRIITYKGNVQDSLMLCLTKSNSFWLQLPVASEPWASVLQKPLLGVLLRKRCQSHVLMSLDLLIPKYLFMTLLHLLSCHICDFQRKYCKHCRLKGFRLEQEW